MVQCGEGVELLFSLFQKENPRRVCFYTTQHAIKKDSDTAMDVGNLNLVNVLRDFHTTVFT